MDKKRIYIAACSVLLLLALVLTVVFSKKNDIPAEDDCRYPYSFNMAENMLTVTINGPFEKGCRWECETAGEEFMKLASSKQNENRAVFSFSAEKDGVESAVFTLRNESFRDECLFRINVDAEVLRGAIIVLGSSHVDSLSSKNEGAGALYPFFFLSEDSSRFSVMIEGTKAEDWIVSCDSFVRNDIIDAGSGKVMISFTPSPGCAAGVYAAAISAANGSMTIKLSLYADEYSVMLLDHEVISSASASGNASGNAGGSAAASAA